jgi:hypothetical protein
VASPALIYLVCSDRHRNGKTLLSRVLVDHLLLGGSDPFVLDLDHPGGALRDFFPGRTALVDFSYVAGQMMVFDTILASPGRPYVVDLPANLTPAYCAAVNDLGFPRAARNAGFAHVVLFIVDREEDSLKSAEAVEEVLKPDLFVPVRNLFVGSALPAEAGRLSLTLESISPELHDIIADRRFSFRSFQLGDEAEVPLRLRANLKSFLRRLGDGLADIGPALSLLKLRPPRPKLEAP